MATQEKIAAVSELKELFEASNAVILTEYRGLTVAQLKELRRALGAETEYAVVKNTLAAIAAKEAGIDAFEGHLQGPSRLPVAQRLLLPALPRLWMHCASSWKSRKAQPPLQPRRLRKRHKPLSCYCTSAEILSSVNANSV